MKLLRLSATGSRIADAVREHLASQEGVEIVEWIAGEDFEVSVLTGGLLRADGEDSVLRSFRERVQTEAPDLVEIVTDGPELLWSTLIEGLPVVVRVSGVDHLPALGGPSAARAAALVAPLRTVRDSLERALGAEVPVLVASDIAALPVSSIAPEVQDWVGDRTRGDQKVCAVLGFGAEAEVQLLDAIRRSVENHEDWVFVCASSVPGLDASSSDRVLMLSQDQTLPLDMADLVLVGDDGSLATVRATQEAMRSGRAILCEGTSALLECIRPETDGVSFHSPDELAEEFQRLARYPKMRARLGGSAARRYEERFGPDAAASQSLRIWFYAAGLEKREEDSVEEPEVLLGPANWYEAWWFARTERRPTRFERNEDGSFALEAVSLNDLRAVAGVLVRAFADGPRDWDSLEWQDLRDLEDAITERLLVARRDRGSADAESALGFPPADHTAMELDGLETLLDESWRFEESDGFAGWLSSTVGSSGFTRRAADRVQMRRLAVEAARRAPSAEIFAVLGRLYRQESTRERIVADDRAFLERSDHGDRFEKSIAELGLHAELPTEKFPKARPGAAPDPVASPRLTVLIPSYKHEAYIERAIQSCLRQTTRDLRVLVADDRSPDRTVEVARSIDDPRLEVVVNETNLGLGSSVRAALERVDTPFVALLNSDDIFHPERIEKCLDAFEQTELDLVATGFETIDADDRLIDSTNTSAVGIGPQAHGWLRWFAGVKDSLTHSGDFTSFETLLRHNVLATSSNMVFRTGWLKHEIVEAADLRYCLDWWLFLKAAVAGRLGFVPEPLLAYRLHDSNTVWFRDGFRADYVIEVNRVVDAALDEWFERTTGTDDERVRQLAELIEGDVAAHGETDGAALYLAGLIRRRMTHRIEPGDDDVSKLASRALRRKSFDQVLQDLDVDPWSLPWKCEIAERYPLEHEVSERLSARSRRLQEAFDREQLRGEQLTQEVQDLRQTKAGLDGRIEQLRGDRTELEERIQQKLQLTEDLEQRLAAQRERGQDLEERNAKLRETNQELTRRNEEIRKQRDEVETLRASLRQRHDEVVREQQRTEAELEALKAAHEALDAELVSAKAEIASVAAALAEAHTRTDDLEQQTTELTSERDRLRGRLEERNSELSASQKLLSWRTDMLDLAFEQLRDPAGSRGREGGRVDRFRMRLRRTGWHLGRALSAEGLQRKRLFLLSDGVVPKGEGSSGSPLVPYPRLWRLGFGDLHRGADRNVRIPDDATAGHRDAAYFEHLYPEITKHLRSTMIEDPLGLDRAFSSARALKDLGAGLCLVRGAGREAVAAFAAHRLAGIPFVWILADEDLVDSVAPEALLSEMARHAAFVCADTEILAARIREMGGGDAVLEQRPACPLLTGGDAGDPGDQLRIVAAFTSWKRIDSDALVAIATELRRRAVPFRLDVLGPIDVRERHARERVKLLTLRRRAQLMDQIGVHHRLGVGEQRVLFATAHVGLWLESGAGDVGSPRPVLDALRSGLPIVASNVQAVSRLQFDGLFPRSNEDISGIADLLIGQRENVVDLSRTMAGLRAQWIAAENRVWARIAEVVAR